MNQCAVFWGSHGCSLERGHDGNHHCCEGSEVDQDGKDAFGFQWFLYGQDAPTEEGRGE